MFKQLLTSLAIASMANLALALDNSLYAEAAPDDASFVRFFGFDEGSAAEFGGKSFELNKEDATAYIPVSSALLENVPAGLFATVLRDADGQSTTIIEGPRDVSTKVHLFLVNASQRALDLRLADNSATVIDAVQTGSAAQRGVNPVAVTLGVFEDGSDIPLAQFDVTLKRGQNISFIADQTGIRMVENRFGAVAH